MAAQILVLWPDGLGIWCSVFCFSRNSPANFICICISAGSDCSLSMATVRARVVEHLCTSNEELEASVRRAECMAYSFIKRNARKRPRTSGVVDVLLGFVCSHLCRPTFGSCFQSGPVQL